MDIKCGVVNGVKYYAFTSYDEVIDFIENNRKILVAVNAGKLNSTEEVKNIINNNIGYCDGIGAVWPLRRKGFKEATTIAGCDLWTKIIARWVPLGRKFYFVGGKQEVIDKTIEKLKVEFQGIHIVGYRNGYIKSEEEKRALIDDIIKTEPDIVFVAMGSPRQELLMSEMYSKYPSVYQGLGGSFDVFVGEKKAPPQWVLDHHVYGPYRVLSDLTWVRVKRFVKDFTFLAKVFLGIVK